MRIFITGLVVVTNFILQTTLLNAIEIVGVLPNTAIILVISYALLRGSVEGAMVGVGVGLLEDIFFGTSVGYFTLLFMLTGYLAGRSHKDFYRENYLMPIILSFIAVFLYQTAIYVTSFLFRGELNFWYFLSKFILPEAVYTAIFSVLVYRILFAINDTLELKEKYKYRLF